MKIAAKGSFRLRKKERITEPLDFRRIMRLGRRRSSGSFKLFVQKSDSAFHRLGIVVKKDTGTAAFRNRMKRYIREFFRLHKHEIKGCYDFVLMIQKGCSFDRYQEAEKELRGLFIL